MRTPALAAIVLAALYAPALAAAPSQPAIGAGVDNFTLRDFHGKPYSLDQLADKQVVVLAFLGTECPLAKIYASRLTELAAKYEPQGVVFVGINANRQDAVTEIAAFARAHEIEFPILKDLNQDVTDAVGATRTPEVVVLDAQRRIRYRGRIDDQYGFNERNANYQKTAPDKERSGRCPRCPVGRQASGPGRNRGARLLDRPQPQARGRQPRDLFEPDRADHERQLRVLPPRRTDRAVHAHQLRRRGRLGFDDQRSGAVAADAALARQSSSLATSATTPG